MCECFFWYQPTRVVPHKGLWTVVSVLLWTVIQPSLWGHTHTSQRHQSRYQQPQLVCRCRGPHGARQCLPGIHSHRRLHHTASFNMQSLAAVIVRCPEWYVIAAEVFNGVCWQCWGTFNWHAGSGSFKGASHSCQVTLKNRENGRDNVFLCARRGLKCSFVLRLFSEVLAGLRWSVYIWLVLQPASRWTVVSAPLTCDAHNICWRMKYGWCREKWNISYLWVHISGTTDLNVTKFCVHVICGHGLVVLWRRSNTLYTSALVDDFTFSHNRPDGTHK